MNKGAYHIDAHIVLLRGFDEKQGFLGLESTFIRGDLSFKILMYYPK